MEIYKVYCTSALGGEREEGLYIDRDYALGRRDELNKDITPYQYQYRVRMVKVCTNKLEVR